MKAGETITFINLIKDAISNTNSEISKIYLPTSITNATNQNIYNLIAISSSNFIDEQGKEMTYYEILEEIAKYLSLTVTVDKDSVYFIDYIGIKNGFNQYYLYQGSTTTTVTLSDSKTIQNIGYSGDSSRLSINSGKNKAKVTCSLFDIDELLPEFDDEKATYYKDVDTTNLNDNNYYLVRYYNQPKFKFYYDLDSKEGDRIQNNNDNLGSVFVKTTNYNINNKPSKLSMVNEIQIKNYIKNSYGSITNYLNNDNKVITFNSNKGYTFNNNVYFSFNCSIKVCRKIIEYDNTIINFVLGDFFIPIKLKIGNYYYNGTEWTTSESKFNIPISVNGTHDLSKYITIENENSFELGLSNLEGFVFKAPDFPISGTIELSIYNFSKVS